MHSTVLKGGLLSGQGNGLEQLAGWLEAQAAFARLAAAGVSANPGMGEGPELFADAFRRLFPVPEFPSAASPAGNEALPRFQAALQGFQALLNEAALDAGRRLVSALAESGPQAPPIQSVRELRALWIDCGEAAWSAMAHRDPFAAALAELLVAWAAMRAAGRAA